MNKKILFFSPLAQFDIVEIIPIRLLNSFDISITNAAVSIMLVIIFFFFIFFLLSNSLSLIPSNWQFFFENLFLFVYSIVVSKIGVKGLKFAPFIVTVFFFILGLNLLSMLFFSFAVTTQVVWTLTLTISLVLGLLLLGFYRHKAKMLTMFVPAVPKFLLALMIPLEIVSYLIRAFSLGLRLSANILAGHTLVHIISDMSQGISAFNLDLSILCIILLCGIMLMELGVACLQAYIFVLLMSIYINDVYNFSGH